MLFKTAIDLFMGRFQSLNLVNPQDRSIAKNYFNQATQEVYRATHWSFRKRVGQLILVPNYTTGTCSITQYDTTNEQAARTVTFSGSTLTQSMVGRYFQPQGSQNWYKIIYINGSTVYLDTPIVEASAVGATFQIWKRFYYLKSDVDVITDFGSWERGVSLNFMSSTGLTDSTSVLSSTGAISTFAPYGVDPYDDVSYSAGTISGNQDDTVVVGSGTNWMGNVDSGDILKYSDTEYTVKRVESDARIILQQHIMSAIAAGGTYSIRKNNPIGFEFYYSADNYRILHYEYMARTYPLLNELNDNFQMPDEYLIATWDRAEAMLLKDKDLSKWSQVLQLYGAELDGLKLKRFPVETRFNQFAPKISDDMPGRSSRR